MRSLYECRQPSAHGDSARRSRALRSPAFRLTPATDGGRRARLRRAESPWGRTPSSGALYKGARLTDERPTGTDSRVAAEAATSDATPGTAIDPICGMTVSTDSLLRSTRGGETFYFCNPACKARFDAGEREAASGERAHARDRATQQPSNAATGERTAASGERGQTHDPATPRPSHPATKEQSTNNPEHASRPPLAPPRSPPE